MMGDRNPAPLGLSPPSDQPIFAVILPQEDEVQLGRVCRRIGLAVYTLEGLLAERRVHRDASGKAVSAEVPAIFLGAVLASDAGERALAGDRDALALFCSLLSYDQHRVVLATDPKLLEWLAMRTAMAAEVLLQDSTSLRRALATLRVEHEDMLQKFAALEGMARSGTPRRICKLRFPATRTSVTLPASSPEGERRFTQRIPLAPKGLAAIVLDVARPTRGAPGQLQVVLKLARGEEAIEEWRIPTQGVEVGPLALRLPRALDRNGMDVVLEVGLEGGRDSEITLSLSSPTPLSEYSLVTAEGVSVGAPLALTAWGSAPGLAVADNLLDDEPNFPDEFGVLPKTPAAAQRYPLFADELEGVVRIQPLEVNAGFDIVAYRREEGDLLIHPVDGDATVAVIANLALRHAQSVSATVVVDNLESAPVEFGLAIVPRQAGYADPSDLIRRWTRVEPLTYAEVQGEVHSQAGEPADLLLATRMADGARSHLAWAFFKRIEIVA